MPMTYYWKLQVTSGGSSRESWTSAIIRCFSKSSASSEQCSTILSIAIDIVPNKKRPELNQHPPNQCHHQFRAHQTNSSVLAPRSSLSARAPSPRLYLLSQHQPELAG